jgi:hypothetical protein
MRERGPPAAVSSAGDTLKLEILGRYVMINIGYVINEQFI